MCVWRQDPKSSLLAVLAHSSWTPPNHPTWILDVSMALRQVVCAMPEMGPLPAATHSLSVDLLASFFSSLWWWPSQLQVLAADSVPGPCGSGDPLAFPLGIIRVWLLYLGLSSTLSTPYPLPLLVFSPIWGREFLCSHRPMESQRTRTEHCVRERRLTVTLGSSPLTCRKIFNYYFKPQSSEICPQINKF